MTQSGHGQEGQSWGQAPGQPWGPPPPQAAPGEDPATQYLRPVPPASAPLPPERGQAPAENPAESTQFLGTGFGAQPPQYQQPQYQQPSQPPYQQQPPHHQPQQHPQAYPPQHPQAYPPPQGQQPPYPQQPQHQQRTPDPDAEATQYIAPVPGHSGPPAEFDSLFRDDAAGGTQQMPRVEPSAPHQGYGHQPPPPHQGYGRQPPPPHGQQPPPPYADPHGHGDYDEPERRRSSKLPLLAAVIVGCAVVGLGAGALMSGGEEAPDTGDKAGVAAASSPTPAPKTSSEPAPDPVKAQAEALDKLLADSNDSRAAVIRSVENIKKCQALDKAAADLREAAGQRRDLVNRLRGIEIDKLPNHTELSSSLTRAWQASATADDHYAAWAQQVKNPKNCKDGRARNTGSTAQAAVASGEATEAKRQAARLWNGIAETYGLTERQPTQL
ncbi:hypothetical protein [Streptomyces roseolilacinus]|uniref:hypothetical protein n=1 Tax=Streptomyces roseolilacinus TaxID=66904 RepID=UPI0037FC7F37